MSKLLKQTYLMAAATAMLLAPGQVSAQNELTLRAEDYTYPAWIAMLRQVNTMATADMPYSINMTVNGDPSTRMAFTWFTNPTEKPGILQLVAKANASDADFVSPDLVVSADLTQVNGLNYSIEKNLLEGVAPGEKVDYTSHKALATGLVPATTYSFRVGNGEKWSDIGSFTTAPAKKDEPYSFIYITDTQAQNDQMFNVSQKTVHAAMKEVPDASFILCNGDLVETSGADNSEWEYEQWFSTMQDVWLQRPLVVTMGNHDKSPNGNFGYHFFNSTEYNDNAAVRTAMDGTVFSFVWGDVLYMVISFEDYATDGYLESLAEWMRSTVEANKDVKWRVASFHKNVFTGSKSHQDDADSKAVRKVMLPVFDELGINVALQGHDHIYEIIGPVKNVEKTLVDSGVESVEIVGDGGERENMTGKAGGVFDVSEGTLYFLNNSAGKKKYEPRSEEEMMAALSNHEVENYWGLFSGKFGQTGEPTFSKVEVLPEAFIITTYTVDDAGIPTMFDSFKVIKGNPSSILNIEGEKENREIFIQEEDILSATDKGVNKMEIYDLGGKVLRGADSSQISTADLPNGIYIVKARGNSIIYTQKIVKG